MPRTSTAIHKDAVNFTPAVMARATVARSTDELPTHGALVSERTRLSQPQTSKLLAAMQANGDAMRVGAGITEDRRAVTLVAGTKQLREQAEKDSHLARAMGLLEFAERRGKNTGAAFDELLGVGHAILAASNPELEAPETPVVRNDTFSLSPDMMIRASVARATDANPTYGAKISQATGLNESGVSRMLAGMRESSEAVHAGQAGLVENRHIVNLVAGTEQLREQAMEDVHLQRAMGLLSFAERKGISPGAAFDELLRIGNVILETADVEMQAPAELIAA